MKLTRRDFLKTAALGAASVGAMGLMGAAAGAEAEQAPAYVPEDVIDVDVLVCGLGVSGMIAATHAAEMGVKVLAIDPALSMAGSNASGIQGIMAVEGSEQLKYENYLTKEEFFTAMWRNTHYQSNAALLRSVCEASGPAIDVLVNNGAPFMYGFPETGEGDAFMYRGGYVWMVSGAERAEILQTMLDNNGVATMWGTRAVELITDGQGTVLGAYAVDGDEKVYQINAKGGVCLCCGGFIHNEEMVERYYGCHFYTRGNSYCNGTGVNMAMAVGAQMGKNHSTSIMEGGGVHSKDSVGGGSIVNCNSMLTLQLLGGLMVNKRGERFMNEQYEFEDIMMSAEALIREGKYYMVIDAKQMEQLSGMLMMDYLGFTADTMPDNSSPNPVMVVQNTTLSNIFADAESAVSDGFCWKADSIQELADILNMPHLAETVERYNGFCAAGMDSEMYKDARYLRAVEEGPFYIVESEVGAWLTLGGIKTDSQCRALNFDGDVIPGLFEGGCDCDAWAIPYNCSGTASGYSIATGYIAGEAAAKRAMEL